MKLDDLLPNLGEWLRGTGPESDVVVSTRIRLARNLADLPFATRATTAHKAEVISRAKDAISKAGAAHQLEYADIPAMAALDRQFLVERQLISRELAGGLDGPRGVAFDPTETASVMVNEEDHLRLQVLRSGFALDEAWQDVNALDDALERRLSYAFHAQFGYLTACPTNVGTGMRASVMLHLPALGLTKQIDKVFRALQKINLAVRGLHGEGSRAFGDLNQISNHVTLGKSEEKLLGEIREVIVTILQYERQARAALVKERRQAEHDRVARAIGTLGSATMITAEETMELLSAVRLGIHLHLLDGIPVTAVNQLFIHTQSAHLQKLAGHPLDGEERNAARAKYLKTKLRELGPHK
ncbi:MAG: protein arginine kinase [Gemmata sp.]